MNPLFSRTEQAQIAMMLEVCAPVKPGNVDRGHDYPTTRLEHFLSSVIFCRSALEDAEQKKGGIGSLINEACRLTGRQNGGNTHFGAFILLIPLVMGGDIAGARDCIRKTDNDDAIQFYKAFSHLEVRVNDVDELDVRDPTVLDELRSRGLSLYQVMEQSAPNDMVAREWINGFSLTRKAADLLRLYEGEKDSIQVAFLDLLATEPDTFIIKKFGPDRAEEMMKRARQVKQGEYSLDALDEYCIAEGINPGSLADILIAGIYIAIGEGWKWDA